MNVSQGSIHKKIKVKVNESDQVSDIQERIRKQVGIPMHSKLLLKLKKMQLDPNRILISYYDIEHMSTLDLEGRKTICLSEIII